MDSPALNKLHCEVSVDPRSSATAYLPSSLPWKYSTGAGKLTLKSSSRKNSEKDRLDRDKQFVLQLKNLDLLIHTHTLISVFG